MNLKSIVISAILLLSGFLIPDLSICSAAVPGSDTLFSSDRIISMELRTDFSAIQAERTGNPVFHEGRISYRTKGGKKVVLPVNVMVRGNFRLNPVNCDFPPLMLDFSNSNVKSTLFDSQKKIKLVTPCRYEKDVIDEFIVYKMYNEVSDKSHRVRLVRITYIDESTGTELFVKLSFFIEEKNQMAERNNSKVLKSSLRPDDLNRENLLRLSFFQYIIGNLDWSIDLSKNLVFLESEDSAKGIYAVPFDFDFSAFVNAEYSRPRGLIEDPFTERRQFKGMCFTEAELLKASAFYRELKPVFNSIIKKYYQHSSDDKNIVLNYVNQFYTILDDTERFRSEFLKFCGD